MSFMLIAAILASFGLMALATVALAAGLSIIPFQRIRSMALTMLWIVPALAVVGLVHQVRSANTQRMVERRAVPESGETLRPKPAAVRQVVLTSDSLLPAEAPDGAP